MNAAQKSARRPKGSGHLRRSEILDAAERIFFEVGYQGATVRKIAQEVGVSSTAIYLHFPDKHAMLSEIAANAISVLHAQAKAIAEEKIDAAERVRKIMRAHMAFALANRSAYQVVFGEAQGEIKEGRAYALGIEYYQCFAVIVAELANEGRLKAGHPHTVSQTLWAGCHGLVDLIIANPQFGWMPLDELQGCLVETMLDGALKP